MPNIKSRHSTLPPPSFPFSDSVAKIHEKSNGVEVAAPKAVFDDESQENEEGQDRPPKGHKAPATSPTPTPPPPPPQLPPLPQQPPPPPAASMAGKFLFPGKVQGDHGGRIPWLG